MTAIRNTATAAAASFAAMLALAAPASANLACTNGSGDVVAYPIITNQGATAISAGTTVRYMVKYPNGQSQNGAFVLSQPLNPGNTKSADQYYPWNFTCTASAQVRYQQLRRR